MLKGEFNGWVGIVAHALADAFHHPSAVGFTPYDVELRTIASPLRIFFISLTSCGNHAATVEIFGVMNLCGKSIAHRTFTQFLSRFSRLRGWVARLNHKFPNRAVEEQTVVELFVDQLDEIVAVYGGVIKQGNGEISTGGLEAYKGARLNGVGCRNTVGRFMGNHKTTCPTCYGKAGK